jgi:hypothetical protein
MVHWIGSYAKFCELKRKNGEKMVNSKVWNFGQNKASHLEKKSKP